MNDDPRARIGRILSLVGYGWIVLFFLANFFDTSGTALEGVLAFFGNSFFIPIFLIFGGRSLTRRIRQLGRPTETEPDTQQQPRPQPQRPPTPPAPRQPTPEPVVEAVDIEDLAAAIGVGIGIGEEESEPLDAGLDLSDSSSRSSADMIKEAHEKWFSGERSDSES